MASVCAGCHQKLDRKKMTCAYCKNSYDLECANISIQRFLNTMTIEHKKTWKCQACNCKTPKTGNTDSCIRPPEKDSNEESDLNYNMNVTIRNKTKGLINDSTINTENLSMLGDTISTETDTYPEKSTEFILQHLSEIISSRLKENNKTIITDLQNTIQLEITKAINKLKEDIYQETNKLSLQTVQNKSQIEDINIKIENLREENKKMKKHIDELNMKVCSNIQTEYQYTPENVNNNKKIVIYGFIEYHRELNSDLHERILQMFHELFNINLNGYIEDIHRLGKYNNKIHNRPIVIELLSKRLTKYILQNSNYL
jgi:hypothetical protein